MFCFKIKCYHLIFSLKLKYIHKVTNWIGRGEVSSLINIICALPVKFSSNNSLSVLFPHHHVHIDNFVNCSHLKMFIRHRFIMFTFNSNEKINIDKQK